MSDVQVWDQDRPDAFAANTGDELVDHAKEMYSPVLGSERLPEEPLFTFRTLDTVDVARALARDRVTALICPGSYIVAGTESGVVHVFDQNGHRLRALKPHSAAVTDLAFDGAAAAFASTSIDGTVLVSSLGTPPAETYAFDFGRPMCCIALSPTYASSTARPFVCGGMAGKLVLHQKGWTGHRQTVLFDSVTEAGGPIWAVQWFESCIVWSTDDACLLHDPLTSKTVTLVRLPPNSVRSDLHRPHIMARGPTGGRLDQLIVGWADKIHAFSLPKSPELASLQRAISLDTIICGLSFFEAGLLVLSPVHAPGDEDQRKIVNLSMRVMDLTSIDFVTQHLPQQYAVHRPASAYSIAPSVAKEAAFVLSTSEKIIAVQTRSVRDRIDWFVKQHHLARARCLAEQSGLSVEEINDLGQLQMQSLFEAGKIQAVLDVMPRYLDTRPDAWHYWIKAFCQKSLALEILPLVPFTDPILDSATYTLVLLTILREKPEKLVDLLGQWSPHLYDTDTIITSTKRALDLQSASMSSDSDLCDVLKDALRVLFCVCRQWSLALPLYRSLERHDTIRFIESHALLPMVKNELVDIVDLAQRTQEPDLPNEAIKLLVFNTHSITVSDAYTQLKARPEYLWDYLNSLFDYDYALVVEYADELLQLCIDYDRPKLLTLLRSKIPYSLSQAYERCQENYFVPEMVYLLTRMGNSKKALHLIIDGLQDAQRAIEFVKEQNDQDLWNDLLDYSEDRPDFLGIMLEHVGVHVDPLDLMNRISDNISVPGLQNGLLKIFQDYQSQNITLDCVKQISSKEYQEAYRILMRKQLKGLLLNFQLGSSSTSDTIDVDLNDDMIRHSRTLMLMSDGDCKYADPNLLLSSRLASSGVRPSIGERVADAALLQAALIRRKSTQQIADKECNN